MRFCSPQLNVWKSPSIFGRPVDILVPSVSLLPVKSFLKSQGLDYSVTIEDLQVGRPGTLAGLVQDEATNKTGPGRF